MPTRAAAAPLSCALLAALIPWPAASLGAGSCGSCDAFPESKYDSIASLETLLADADPEHVRRLVQASEICAPQGFRCGNLTEEDAKMVATHYLDTRWGWWKIAAWAGSLILGFAVIAGLAINILNRYRPRN